MILSVLSEFQCVDRHGWFSEVWKDACTCAQEYVAAVFVKLIFHVYTRNLLINFGLEKLAHVILTILFCKHSCCLYLAKPDKLLVSTIILA